MIERIWGACDRCVDDALLRAYAVDEGHIFFLQLMAGALLGQPGCGDRVLGEQLDAGGVLVQPADGVQAAGASLIAEQRVELDAHRVIVMPMRRVKRHAGRLA